jgi:hypothetical protein
MPKWLWQSIIGLSVFIALITGGQWLACRFYVLPMVWTEFVNKAEVNKSKLEMSPVGCIDADSRAITVLMGLLTTLISLSRNAD